MPADGAGAAGDCDQRSCPAAGRCAESVAAAPCPKLYQLSGAGGWQYGPDGGTVHAGRTLRPVEHPLCAAAQRSAVLAAGGDSGSGGGAVRAYGLRMVAAAGSADGPPFVRGAFRRRKAVFARRAADMGTAGGGAAGMCNGAGRLESGCRPPCRGGHCHKLGCGAGGYPALRQQRGTSGGRYDQSRPPADLRGHHAGGHHDPAYLLLSPGLRGRGVCQQPLEHAGQQDPQRGRGYLLLAASGRILRPEPADHGGTGRCAGRAAL